MQLRAVQFSLFFFSIPLLALAAEPDPWSLIDARVHQAALCEAFVDQGIYTFHRKSCSALGCDAWDYQVKTLCQDGVATIEQSNHGQIFSRQTLSQADWEKIRGNLLRAQAAFSESFGQVFSLDRVQELADGTLRADFTVRAGSAVREMGYWVFGTGPSVSQVLERNVTRLGFLKEENSDVLLR